MNTQENVNMIKPRQKADLLTSEQKKAEKEKFKKSLAIIIKNARKAKGFKQEDVSALANLNLTYVNHLERGVYIPTSYVLWKIAKALNISFSELVKGL